MKRFAFLFFALAFAPGCLVHHWTATPDGKILAGYIEKKVVVADGELKALESYDAPGKPAIVEVSPDGKWVVYNTEDSNELWLVDRTAKTQKKVAANAGEFLYNAWSPDSNRLAFMEKSQKDGPFAGLLRIYNVKTGETFTALEDCTPAYGWTPSGDALFAVQLYHLESEGETHFGRLVRWTDGEKPVVLAHVAEMAFLEALNEEEVLFTSAIATLPAAPAEDPFKTLRFGLFRASKSGVERLGTTEIAWFSLSPDRKRMLSLVIEPRKDGEEMKSHLDLADATGKTIRQVKDSKAYEGKSGPLVPLWLGNGRVLVPLGDADTRRFERVDVETGEATEVTETWKGWTK